MKKKRNSSPGMFTVEMAIIFPIVILSIMALFYYSAVHYQNISLRVNTQRINSRIAVAMSNGDQGHNNILESDGSNWDTVFSSADMKHPTLFGYSGLELSAGAQAELNETAKLDYSPYLASESQPSPQVSSDLFFSWVVTEGERSYTSPLGNLFQQFGIERETDGTARSEQMIQDIPNYLWNYRAIKNIRKIGG